MFDLFPLSLVDFSLLFEACPHPYLVLLPNSDFTIVAANDCYLAATGTERAAIVGRALFEVFPENPDDASSAGVSDLCASLQRVIRDRAPDVMDIQKYDIPCAGDAAAGFEVRYWSSVNTPVFRPDGSIAYLIHHVEDVTEFILTREQDTRESAAHIEKVQAHVERVEAEILRRAKEVKEANRKLKAAMEALKLREAELTRLNKRLQELDHAKTEFFSNVSHEFRTPLTLMLGPIEDMLAGKRGGLPDSLRADIELFQHNALRLLKLVNTLLDFSRLEAGRMRATYQPTDLALFTREIAATFRSIVEGAGLLLLVDTLPLTAPIYVDRNMWEKIVLNLLSNAFKFTLKGSIRVSLHERGDYAELVVADTGCGIPEHELPHMFERFHRVEGAKGRSFEGSGIGLALVREFAALHGGSVSVSSVERCGSTFIVTIPRGCAHLPSADIIKEREAPDVAVSAPYWLKAMSWNRGSAAAMARNRHAEAVPVTPKAAAGKGTERAVVLVADDNSDMRAYLAHILSQYWHVLVAGDGEAALQQVRECQPDLVLSDVMMPRMDGFTLLRTLRADPATQEIPVVLLSARAGEDALLEGFGTGADDYLIKPFSHRELLARVRSHLGMAQLRRH